MESLPEIKITVFSDYICPFCYVGHHRLMRLKDSYALKINWRFLEIHPENSPQGEPVSSLDYPSEYWNQLMHNLRQLAEAEDIPLAEHEFTTNSRDALLLAEAAKALGKDTFYALHEALFRAFFVDSINIGDRDALRKIAHQQGIETDFVEQAWENKSARNRLAHNYIMARQYQVQSVPSFIFDDRVLTGVVSEDVMRDAAERFIATGQV